MTKSKIDHDRLDQILSWAPQFFIDHTTSGEFEVLDILDKPRLSQKRRALHLRRHMTAGELICDCFERMRTDRLGRGAY